MSEAKRELFVHEDDEGMIELVLPEQRDFIQQELNELSGFAETHRTDQGYTDIYVRKSNPEGLSSLGIKMTDIHQAIADFAPPYDKVITGYGSTYRVEYPDMQAFGPDEETVLFCEHRGGMLYKAWLIFEFNDPKRYAWSLKLLRKLGEMAPFLLVDWIMETSVDLQDDPALQHYLRQYVEEKKTTEP
ncbi:hypothetical protein [Saccharibacillus sp. JS10]|uniref:hypothetical protein n=1 Tax=Saccharibacillus sp. JS10 TaxID=2950552 RepID=UPI00210EC6E9|nr:hypothetical protein [Saccharibacillus sp. JS10]MCQ4087388.1 hypothetical protein [Saccharibacillus sp. JS10]